MKTVLSSDGTLSITAETPLEDYALRKWIVDFKQGDTSLQVLVSDLNRPNDLLCIPVKIIKPT